MTIRPARARAALFLGVAALSLSGCATTAEAQTRGVTTITQAEARQGAEAHQQLQAEFGAPMTGPQADYVRQVGQGIAVQSNLANARSAFTVSLLDSSVNNAFAIPGGYVYTTRQLVALMNNEAELAGVLGHEVAHVALRHSKSRQKRATLNQILGIAGQFLGSVVGGGLGNVLAQGAQLGSQAATASFSRKQELQADDYGIRYLKSAGYDPRAMSTVLQNLALQNALDQSLLGRTDARMPAWASTHPDPASRVKVAERLAGTTAGGRVDRDTFLTRIDGLTYGDDPQTQGVIEGRRFIHPGMRLTFEVPSGYYMVNSPQAVSINGPSGQAQLKAAPYNGNLDTYVRQAFASLSQQFQPPTIRQTSINGLPAAVATLRTSVNGSALDVSIVAYEFSNNKAFHFVTITQAGRSNVFNSMANSMQQISAQQAAQVIPRVIDVVTVGRNDTVQSLAARMAYTDEQERRFRVLNGLANNQTVTPGQRVKLVVRAR